MSDSMIEIRKIYKSDGTIQHLYRIGTDDWVEIKHLDLSELFERSDDYIRQNPSAILLNKDDV